MTFNLSKREHISKSRAVLLSRNMMTRVIPFIPVNQRSGDRMPTTVYYTVFVLRTLHSPQQVDEMSLYFYD